MLPPQTECRSEATSVILNVKEFVVSVFEHPGIEDSKQRHFLTDFSQLPGHFKGNVRTATHSNQMVGPVRLHRTNFVEIFFRKIVDRGLTVFSLQVFRILRLQSINSLLRSQITSERTIAEGV